MTGFGVLYKKTLALKKLSEVDFIVKKTFRKQSERNAFLESFLLDWLEQHEFKNLTRYQTVKKKTASAYQAHTTLSSSFIELQVQQAVINQLIRKIKSRSNLTDAYIQDQIESVKAVVPVDEQLFNGILYDIEPGTDLNAPSNFVNRTNYRVSKTVLEIQNPAKTWQTKAVYLKPKNLKGMVQCFELAIQTKKPIRGVGIRFSFSEVVHTGGAYIDTTDTHNYSCKSRKQHRQTVKMLDQTPITNLKAYRANKDLESQLKKLPYINIPASLRVGELNSILYPDFKKHKPEDLRFGPRRIINMGGSDLQAFAGASMTGTHGNGGVKSALHDMYRSILLVTVEQIGKEIKPRVLRIEPTDGITDSASYPGKEEGVPVSLVQDDKFFYALLVSMGSMGVMYSAIVETLPMKSFTEDVRYLAGEEGGWQKAKQEFAKRSFLKDLEDEKIYYNLLVNPYQVSGNQEVSLVKRRIEERSRVISKKEIPAKARKRKFIPRVLTSIVQSTAISKFSNSKGPTSGSIERTLKAVQDRTDDKTGGYTDIFYHAVPAGTEHFKDIGVAVEYTFPFEKFADALDQVMEFLRNQKELINAPLAVRFMKSSDAYLAMNHKKDQAGKTHKIWVAIEILKIRDIRISAAKNTALLRKMQDFMLGLGGRPHWGLGFDLAKTLSRDKIMALYPNYSDWLEVHELLNPPLKIGNKKYRAFSNRFTDAITK